MPDFSELFIKTKGKPIQYKGKTLVMGDDIPFEDGEEIIVNIEKTQSEWKQGIALDILGFFEINGKKFKNTIALWEDTCPKDMLLVLREDHSKRSRSKKLPPKGMLGIRNIWQLNRGTVLYWVNGAAMIVEEIENGRRYRCNDGYPDEDFDDIIFTVRRIDNERDNSLIC